MRLFSSRSGVSIYKMESLHFLTINLLFNHNVKAMHINIIISKLNTNKTYSKLFKNIFSRFFLMLSEIMGFFSCQTELRFTKWNQYLCV